MITEVDLKQFTGTVNYYKHWLGYHYTDGVQYLAENAGAYWLLDVIASYRRKEPAQFWTLKKTGDTTAEIVMQEDNDQPVLVKQEFDYTDIWKKVEMSEIRVWLLDGVMLLPDEY